MRKFVLATLIVIQSVRLGADEVQLSPNAPKDKQVAVHSTSDLERLHKAMAPYVAQARSSYPNAKERFLNGLPKGQHFFVTTRLRDRGGKEEQVFVAVNSIQSGLIEGTIFSPIQIVSGFRYKQRYSFSEADLIDWLITYPDGSEEGNVVGRFLDTYDGR